MPQLSSGFSKIFKLGNYQVVDAKTPYCLGMNEGGGGGDTMTIKKACRCLYCWKLSDYGR